MVGLIPHGHGMWRYASTIRLTEYWFDDVVMRYNLRREPNSYISFLSVVVEVT